MQLIQGLREWRLIFGKSLIFLSSPSLPISSSHATPHAATSFSIGTPPRPAATSLTTAAGRSLLHPLISSIFSIFSISSHQADTQYHLPNANTSRHLLLHQAPPPAIQHHPSPATSSSGLKRRNRISIPLPSLRVRRGGEFLFSKTRPSLFGLEEAEPNPPPPLRVRRGEFASSTSDQPHSHSDSPLPHSCDSIHLSTLLFGLEEEREAPFHFRQPHFPLHLGLEVEEVLIRVLDSRYIRSSIRNRHHPFRQGRRCVNKLGFIHRCCWVLDNYIDILRNNQIYLVEKSMLINALAGLAHCLSLI